MTPQNSFQGNQSKADRSTPASRRRQSTLVRAIRAGCCLPTELIERLEGRVFLSAYALSSIPLAGTAAGTGWSSALTADAEGNLNGTTSATPFLGHPVDIPTSAIEAENFDEGGEGVAFHDATPQNVLRAYRDTAVDVGAVANASGGFAVGYTYPGEWLSYSITAPSAGTYALQARVANYKPGGTFHVEIDGQNVTGALTVPDTGPWDTWQTITSPTFNVSAGEHVMRVVMDRGGYWSNVGDFDSFRFVQPSRGTPFNISTDTVEAEDFDGGPEGVAYHDSTLQNIPGKYRNTAVDIGAVSNASNGYAVGYTYPGEWLSYTINAPAAGSYVLDARVANFLQGGTFHVEIDGTNVTGSMTVPNTGPWDTWRTLTSPLFSVTAGTHRMKVVMDQPGYWGNIGDFDSFRFREQAVPFHGSPFNVGTDTIQAEDFDSGSDGIAYHDSTPQNIPGKYRTTGVDVAAVSNADNGYAVGYTAPGEWLSYTINSPTQRFYTLEARVANLRQGGTFHVEIDGQDVTGTMTVPDTGPWDTWQTITSPAFTVSAGNHQMRVVMGSGGYWGNIGDFDSFRFAPAGFVTLDSQSRFVLFSKGSPTGPPEVQKQTAPDFGPFSASLFSNPSGYPPEGVTQGSTLSADQNGLVIHHLASAHFPLGSSSTGESYFDVQFTLLTPATYRASYTSSASSHYGEEPGPVSLFSGPGAPGALQPPNSYPGQWDVPPREYSGLLQPGSFEIQSDLQYGYDGSASIEFTVSITPITVAALSAPTVLPSTPS